MDPTELLPPKLPPRPVARLQEGNFVMRKELSLPTYEESEGMQWQTIVESPRTGRENHHYNSGFSNQIQMMEERDLGMR